MKKQTVIAGALVGLIVALALSCSRSSFPSLPEPRNYSLEEIRGIYGKPAIERIVKVPAGEIAFEFFAFPDRSRSVIVAYSVPDSCIILESGEFGLLAVSKPKNNKHWACVQRVLSMCNQNHPGGSDDDLSAWADCMAAGLSSCYVLYGWLGWFCS